MRRLLSGRNPANPKLFEEDLGVLAVEAAGLAVTSWVNDKVLGPLYQKVLSVNGETLGKAVDALGTGVSAWVTGELVGLVAGHRYGNLVRRGGVLLAVGRVGSIAIPGFNISSSLPSGFNWPTLQLGQAKASQAALPSAAVSSQAMLTNVSGLSGL